MIESLRHRIPIRVKLTLWYVLLLAFTFTLFSVYLLTRFEKSLRSALDASLQDSVSKTIAALDEKDYHETGMLKFDRAALTQIGTSVFSMRLVSLDGTVWDAYNASERVAVWGAMEAGATSQNGLGEEDEWRILTQPILDSNGQTIGWVQAAQSLTPVIDAVEGLQGQLFLGIPLLLFFAGFGGYFLASRVLRPIEQITDTAREITAQNLSRKIGYQGSADEVGRLAQTFDQMLERLQSAFERERRFTGDAAHELRTPLTVLKGQIEVTLSRPRNSAEYEKNLRELSAQVERLIRLSNALLFLSRSDQRQFSFEPAVINLCELLEVLIEQIQPLAHEKELKITTKITEGLSVYGDGDHLIRLFMNLLENALKYTPVGGQITITAAKKPDDAEVTIHNTGLGISPEHLPFLFDRLYRADSDRSSETGGTGLGLAIAREIERLHGGEIGVASTPGEGIKFTVYLPNSVN